MSYTFLLLLMMIPIFTAQTMEHKEAESSELLQQRCWISFLDAYFNRDLQVKNDEFVFPSYDRPSAKFAITLQDGFDFFKKEICPKPLKKEKDVANVMLEYIFRGRKSYISTIKKLEDKLAALQNIDEAGKLALNIERCVIFNLFKKVTREEMQEGREENQEQLDYLHKQVCMVDICDIDTFVDHCNNVITVRDALVSEDPSIINNCKRPESIPRMGINDFIAREINRIQGQIVLRDSTPPDNDKKNPNEDCCIS